jgi:hypothetical protein
VKSFALKLKESGRKIIEDFFSEIAIFRRWQNYCRIHKNNLLSSLTCGQIWLIPLVDDC